MQAFTFIAITHNQQYQGLSDCHWTLQPTNQVISHLVTRCIHGHQHRVLS